MNKIIEKIKYESSDKSLYDDIDKIIAGKTPIEMSKYSKSAFKISVYYILLISICVTLVLSNEMVSLPLWATMLAFFFLMFGMLDQSWVVMVLKRYLKKLGEK